MKYAGNFWRLRFLLFFFILGPALGVHPLDDDSRGDSAMAERYALWAKNAIDTGLWSEALAGLERAVDFADVSSDISYLLALARSHEKKDLYSVLQALEMALSADRWNLFDSQTGREAARLMKAENLIAVRAYHEALVELSMTGSSPEAAVLTLTALAHFNLQEFYRYLTETLDRYPRETGPVRVFFTRLKTIDAAGRNPSREDLQLLELIIRRLPSLILRDPELAWMASSFMRDTDEARRMVQAYRAVNNPVRESLPAALRLGVIDEATAMEELFTPGEGTEKFILDIALISEIWDLLRTEDARTRFRRNLLAFNGVISEDTDGDGIPNAFSEYSGGMLRLYTYDANQAGIPDLTVFFEGGNPLRARVFMPPETSRADAAVEWEMYPAVLEVELDGVRYIPRPVDMFFSPIGFIELYGSGILFPYRDSLNPPLTRRVLVSNALRIERPSLEFNGGVEIVELNQGIPVRAREYIGNLMVSETEFLRGRPQLQRVDLDLDGYMDTVRHFRRNYRSMELEELWDYDRDIDYTVTIWDRE